MPFSIDWAASMNCGLSLNQCPPHPPVPDGCAQAHSPWPPQAVWPLRALIWWPSVTWWARARDGTISQCFHKWSELEMASPFCRKWVTNLPSYQNAESLEQLSDLLLSPMLFSNSESGSHCHPFPIPAFCSVRSVASSNHWQCPQTPWGGTQGLTCISRIDSSSPRAA